VKTTVKLGLRFLPLLALLISQSGCTYALWTNGDLDAYKEPAQNPNLQLFESKQRDDYLVVYKEYSERRESTNTRAYWLNKNQYRVENQHAPSFAHKKEVDHLPVVPVFYSLPENLDFNGGLYAVCETNQQSFELYSDGREAGTYYLPVYKDKQGTVEKVALTPFAVSADVAIVGGCAGFIVLDGLCQSGYSFQVGK
jgi:hypothetical protein